jgi:predicted tellurium resistance membrane protein TerC
MRLVLLILGVLAILVGIVWILQGFNILGGSVMSGHSIYALLGLILGLIGVVLVAVGARRRGVPTA